MRMIILQLDRDNASDDNNVSANDNNNVSDNASDDDNDNHNDNDKNNVSDNAGTCVHDRLHGCVENMDLYRCCGSRGGLTDILPGHVQLNVGNHEVGDGPA